MDKIICEQCGKLYSKKGIGTHIWRAHGDGQDHNPNSVYASGSRKAWNKGLTKETNSSVAKMAETIKNK